MICNPRAFFGAALLALLAAAMPAFAAGSLPGGVKAVIDGYGRQCQELGGSISQAAASPWIMTADFDGDGEQDYVLNPQNLQCDGSATAFCGNGGCQLSILLSGDGYKEPLSVLGGEPVIRQRQDRTVVEVWVDGSNCDLESREQTCWQIFSWGEGDPKQSYQVRPASE